MIAPHNHEMTPHNHQMTPHTHDDPEERKHRNYSLALSVLSALVAIGAVGLSLKSTLNADSANRRSLRTAKESLEQQVEMWTLQSLQNPQDLWCSEVARKVIVEEDLLQADVTPKEWDQVCEEVQKLPPSLEVRREFISLLVSNPSERDGIIAAYHELYGEDAEWIEEIAART